MPRRWGGLFALLLAFGAAAATPEEVNDLAGIRIFGTSELWGEAPAAVLRRLNLKCRPEDLGGSQMFASPLRGDVFGCPASEIRIYAARELVNKVDIILFNKGDNVAPGGGDKKKAAKRVNAFRKELRRHHAKTEKLLRDRLGRPRRAFFGSGTMSKQLPAWDCGAHVLMMDYSEGEYLQFHIVPGSAAAEHRSRVSGEERAGTKDSYAGRVRHSDNGDVFISGVPMVNQGQKGYCVPATVERVMRYFGVAGVDMHKLAERFDTGGGGGTTIEGTVRGTRKLLADYGLRMRDSNRLRRQTIIRSVDTGLPVLWFHFSTPDFKERLDRSLSGRSRVAIDEWKDQLAGLKRIRRAGSGAHVALLIGYNRDTDEFAVSNSWGERYRIAWVRFADMEQADAKQSLYIVTPRK